MLCDFALALLFCSPLLLFCLFAAIAATPLAANPAAAATPPATMAGAFASSDGVLRSIGAACAFVSELVFSSEALAPAGIEPSINSSPVFDTIIRCSTLSRRIKMILRLLSMARLSTMANRLLRPPAIVTDALKISFRIQTPKNISAITIISANRMVHMLVSPPNRPVKNPIFVTPQKNAPQNMLALIHNMFGAMPHSLQLNIHII